MWITVYKHEDGRTSACIANAEEDHYTMMGENEYPDMDEFSIPVEKVADLEFEYYENVENEVKTVNDTPENVIKKLKERYSLPYYMLGFLDES